MDKQSSFFCPFISGFKSVMDLFFSSSVFPRKNKLKCLSPESQFQYSSQNADVMSNFRLYFKTISRRNALAYSAPSSVDRKLLCISFFHQ
jgi:hypothetical protein